MVTSSRVSTKASLPHSIRLTGLPVGASARLLGGDLVAEETALLAALGLREGCRFRVCQAGGPWILEVKTTRIGLADTVAARLHVTPEPTS